MKNINFFSLLLINFTSFAQTSMAKIEYEMSTNFDSFSEFTSILHFNDEITTFTYKNKMQVDKVNEKKTENSISINIKKADTTKQFLHFDLQKREFYIPIKNQLIVDDAKQDWKLVNEQKTIGNLVCEKATCTFRGRQYTAWYSKEIPVPFGPYKFYGLPGLIIEVKDELNEVFFTLLKINMPYTEKMGLINTNLTKVTREELKKETFLYLQKRKKEAEETAKISQSTFSKKEKAKIKITEIKINKGIELD